MIIVGTEGCVLGWMRLMLSLGLGDRLLFRELSCREDDVLGMARRLGRHGDILSASAVDVCSSAAVLAYISNASSSSSMSSSPEDSKPEIISARLYASSDIKDEILVYMGDNVPAMLLHAASGDGNSTDAITPTLNEYVSSSSSCR